MSKKNVIPGLIGEVHIPIVPHSGLALKERNKRPNMYKVLVFNDDYTPMDFVIAILTTLFHK